MADKNWLVTGGAGFIGSNFVRWVLANRAEIRVVVLDKLTYAGSLENLRGVADSGRYSFIEADIGSRATLRKILAEHRISLIVHLAAETHVDRSIDGPRTFIDTNIVGTFELLEAARLYYARMSDVDKRGFRFLHVSTDEVYGSLGAEGYFTEQTAYAPNSPYAASKASADLLVRAYHQTYGLPTIISNCSNNFGPFQFPEKLVPLMILNALEGKSLPIYGDGGNIRDWIYVEDHCAGIVRAIEKGRVGEQYVFGGNGERSNLQVVDAICDGLESQCPASENQALKSRGIECYSDLKQFVEDRPGHDRRYAIDASKAKSELGWSPDYDFESALNRTIAWYLEHDEWRQALQAEGDARSRQGLSRETRDSAQPDVAQADPR